jgi:hypothetical protein
LVKHSLLICAVACVPIGGCASSSSLTRETTSPAESKVTTTSVTRASVGALTDEVELLSSWRLPVADEAAASVALQNQVSECMQERGFDHLSPELSDLTEGIRYRNLAEAYDGRPATHASTTIGPAPTESDPNSEIIASLSESERTLYFANLVGSGQEVVEVEGFDGSTIRANADGCYAKARLEIFGSLQELADIEWLVGNLHSAAVASASVDEHVLDATLEWSMCMQAYGYNFAAFSEAAEARATVAGPEFETQLSADISCTESSGLGDAFSVAYEDVVEEYLDKNAEALQWYQQRQLATISDR